MTPFDYVNMYTHRLKKPLRQGERLRAMAQLKGLLKRYRDIGWGEEDFKRIYLEVVTEVITSGFCNSFNYVYGPLRHMSEELQPKVATSDIKFDAAWVKEEVERYRKQMLGG